MVFTTLEDGRIKYQGNKLFPPIDDIKSRNLAVEHIENRIHSIKTNQMWEKITLINDIIFKSTVDFFSSIGAKFIPLPLTTKMISSPGAVYGKKKINYTTDTKPIKLKWFNLSEPVFLSESSQIYLELVLLQNNIDHVFSIYNSFRKEEADTTHLSEFHHIEYEGHVTQEKNLETIESLVKTILKNILKKKYLLEFFLEEGDIRNLEILAKDHFIQIKFKDVLRMLYEETKDEKYKKFTTKYFGFWEEVKITEILGNKIVVIKEFPLLETAFYHAPKVVDGVQVANNADIIWPSYKEFVGSGQRVGTLKELMKKAKFFTLPKKDYEPYLQSRRYDDYKISSGFGMGWERLLQGLLKMPTIISVCHFPRIHDKMIP